MFCVLASMFPGRQRATAKMIPGSPELPLRLLSPSPLINATMDKNEKVPVSYSIVVFSITSGRHILYLLPALLKIVSISHI